MGDNYPPFFSARLAVRAPPFFVIEKGFACPFRLSDGDCFWSRMTQTKSLNLHLQSFPGVQYECRGSLQKPERDFVRGTIAFSEGFDRVGMFRFSLWSKFLLGCQFEIFLKVIRNLFCFTSARPGAQKFPSLFRHKKYFPKNMKGCTEPLWTKVQLFLKSGKW